MPGVSMSKQLSRAETAFWNSLGLEEAASWIAQKSSDAPLQLANVTRGVACERQRYLMLTAITGWRAASDRDLKIAVLAEPQCMESFQYLMLTAITGWRAASDRDLKIAVLAQWRKQHNKPQRDQVETAATQADSEAESSEDRDVALQPKHMAWLAGVTCMGAVASPSTLFVGAAILL